MNWSVFLRALALSLVGVMALLATMFTAGETLSEPGGWAGVGLVASWLVPLVALGLLAWFRPAWATWVLGGLTAAVLAMSAWYALAAPAWRTFEDQHGPVRAIVVFALTLPLALLAWHRPRAGGAMLVAVGVVPVALATVAIGGPTASIMAFAIIGTPVTVAGVLSLVAATLDRHPTPDGLHASTPQAHARAA